MRTLVRAHVSGPVVRFAWLDKSADAADLIIVLGDGNPFEFLDNRMSVAGGSHAVVTAQQGPAYFGSRKALGVADTAVPQMLSVTRADFARRRLPFLLARW